MLIRWTSPDREPREFQWDPGRLLSPDVELIETLGGTVWECWDDFAHAFNIGNRRAYRAALWVCLRTADGDRAPDWDSFSVGPYEVTVDLGERERDIIRAALASGKALDPQEREQFVELLGEDPGAPFGSGASEAPTAG